MKKLKMMIIIVLMLLTTGCSIEYNLDMDKDNASENIIAIFENTPENRKLINTLIKNKKSAYYDADVKESMYYNITDIQDKNDNTNELKLQYSYQYPLEKLKYSNAIADCFYNRNVVKDKKYITLNTSEGVECIYRDIEKQIDKLVVNISTNYKLVETNADTIENNTYTWNITDDNYSTKSIYLKVDYTKENQTRTVINERIIGIYLLIFITVSIVFIFYFKLRSSKKFE